MGDKSIPGTDAKTMRTALESIAYFPKAAEGVKGTSSDFMAGLELAASYASVALDKVKDEGHG